MTSILSSLFTSQLPSRIEALRAAETGLISLSHLFNGDRNSRVEILETPIPHSSIPLLQKPSQCTLLLPSSSSHPDEALNIHSIKVTNPSSSQTTTSPLVLLHGYSNSALYFYRNMQGLARHFSEVHALDMLGWGLSSRPPFDLKEGTVQSAEHFFVESLEQWRKNNSIPKMILGGHSMGGYLSVAYCEKYPQHVEKLILISPVGIPDKERKNQAQQQKSWPLSFRMMVQVLSLSWKAGVTPASFLRSLSEYRGRKLVDGYVHNRLPAIKTQEEKSILAEYLYLNAILPGSGEYCLNKILQPMGYAYNPLVYRIPKLQIPEIDFVYGEKDWMDYRHGVEVKQICKKEYDKKVEVYVVKDAGHLLMLENWEEFNNALVLSGGGMVEEPMPSRVLDEDMK